MKLRNFADYSWFNRILLHACGVLPLESRDFLSFLILLTPFLSSGFLSLPAIHTLVFDWNKLTGMARMDLVVQHVEIIVGVIKVLCLIPKRTKLTRLTKSCSRLWESVDYDRDCETVEPYAMRGLYMTYGFALNVFACCSSFFLTPLFSRFVVDENGTVLVSKSLPYTAGIFHENIALFNVWHLLQVPIGFTSVTAIIAIDTATAFYILHACAHLRLCQTFFRRVANDFATEKPLAMLDNEWPSNSDKIFKNVIRCVVHHQDVLQYSRDVEHIFGPVMLAQTLLSISAICGFCYNLLVEEDMSGRPRFMIHLIGVIVQLLIYCWPANTLQEESIMVADAAYNLPWYDWKSKQGQLVCIIIARSQIPATISAGKFTMVSLETYASILKTAFSMVTLLLRVLE
nr:olfactory receptor 26 [Gregopimpla kuwanae]